MQRHEFLRRLHRVYRPRTYLEIGIHRGHSLTLSRVPSIGIDPEFQIDQEVRCDVQLVRSTSDEFFAREDPLRHLRPGRNPFRALARKHPQSLLGDPTLDLSFIDGEHLFEFALRDWINVERHSDWFSIGVLDDMLPRTAEEASRTRVTQYWTGDVYKMVPVLRKHRPDLVVLPVDTAPTGTVVVFGADPANRVLPDRYDDLVAEHVTDDPQDVPADILERTHAVDPRELLAAPFWKELVRRRNLSARRGAFDGIRAQLEALTPTG